MDLGADSSSFLSLSELGAISQHDSEPSPEKAGSPAVTRRRPKGREMRKPNLAGISTQAGSYSTSAVAGHLQQYPRARDQSQALPYPRRPLVPTWPPQSHRKVLMPPGKQRAMTARLLTKTNCLSPSSQIASRCVLKLPAADCDA